MSTILKGAPVVAAMNEANAARCAALREKGVVPTLAVVRVGERPDDLSYEKGVMARCAKVGVEVKLFLLPADASQEELLRVIASINADAAIHGCLLFRPLPKQFDDRTIRAALSPEKDIDGITDGSLAGVFTNTAVGYPPCTAQACLEILKFYNIPLSGKRAVVVGRSLVVGKPAAMMLDRETPPSPSATPAPRTCPMSAERPMLWWWPWARWALSAQSICGPVRSSWMWASMSTRKAGSAVTSALARQSLWWRPSPPSPAASAP